MSKVKLRVMQKASFVLIRINFNKKKPVKKNKIKNNKYELKTSKLAMSAGAV
ncbi:MAG: hypothetical protein GX559_01680 [Candidatus Pacebacteria bacterium]|nr:hypothetical protein [Candidatus Paceibacterota bacterium]